MSAPQIPNLLTLRGGPRSRGRGRGRGTDHGGGPSTPARQRHDLHIQSTDTDAAVSRLSAVSLGYLDDPFASYFVSGQGTRRLPIINRGTYTRTTALDQLITAFLSEPISGSNEKKQTKQIISLGAGTDTRWFRFRAQKKHQKVIYHEFDFPPVSTTKYRTVANNEILGKGGDNEILFPEPRSAAVEGDVEWGFWRPMNNTDDVMETIYCCHPLDLRHLSEASSQSRTFRGLRTDVPTLIISECCLCYLEVDVSRKIVNWFAERIPSLGIILYEPIGVDDSFGQMMVANLAARNITMPSLTSFKTLADQRARLVELGFNAGQGSSKMAETVERIWNEWIPDSEKERVDGLEGLDEVEEWQMLARHYAVVWGWRGSDGWEGFLLSRTTEKNIPA